MLRDVRCLLWRTTVVVPVAIGIVEVHVVWAVEVGDGVVSSYGRLSIYATK